VTIIKRNKLGSSQSGDWFRATNALLGKQFSEALSAVRFLILRGELLSGQHLVALGAHETFTVPRSVLVRDSSLVDHPVALETPLCILFLVARHADHLLVTWDETLASDWLQTHFAAEALLMPLLALVFKLLHSGFKESTTSVASGREVVIMTVGAVKPVILVGERVIHQ
jgi:hypothetical protein